MKLLTQKQLVLVGVILGAAYGVFARFIFGLGLVGDFFEVMSSAFVIGVPIALGFITIWFGEYRKSNFWVVWLVAPWLASIACLACALVLAWEGIICIVLLLPLILILSSIGGLIAG